MKNRKKLLCVLLLVIALTSCKKNEQVLNDTKEKTNLEIQQKNEDISISKEDDVKSEGSDDFINILQNESKKNESQKTDNNQKIENSDIDITKEMERDTEKLEKNNNQNVIVAKEDNKSDDSEITVNSNQSTVDNKQNIAINYTYTNNLNNKNTQELFNINELIETTKTKIIELKNKIEMEDKNVQDYENKIKELEKNLSE